MIFLQPSWDFGLWCLSFCEYKVGDLGRQGSATVLNHRIQPVWILTEKHRKLGWNKTCHTFGFCYFLMKSSVSSHIGGCTFFLRYKNIKEDPVWTLSICCAFLLQTNSMSGELLDLEFHCWSRSVTKGFQADFGAGFGAMGDGEGAGFEGTTLSSSVGDRLMSGIQLIRAPRPALNALSNSSNRRLINCSSSSDFSSACRNACTRIMSVGN